MCPAPVSDLPHFWQLCVTKPDVIGSLSFFLSFSHLSLLLFRYPLSLLNPLSCHPHPCVFTDSSDIGTAYIDSHERLHWFIPASGNLGLIKAFLEWRWPSLWCCWGPGGNVGFLWTSSRCMVTEQKLSSLICSLGCRRAHEISGTMSHLHLADYQICAYILCIRRLTRTSGAEGGTDILFPCRVQGALEIMNQGTAGLRYEAGKHLHKRMGNQKYHLIMCIDMKTLCFLNWVSSWFLHQYYLGTAPKNNIRVYIFLVFCFKAALTVATAR